MSIKTIFEQAEKKLGQSFNSPDLIPFAKEILSLANSENEDDDLLDQFKLAWSERWGPYELISICMHKLKWPSLKSHFEMLHRNAVKENDWRSQQCLSHVLDAFEPEWEDAIDFYSEIFANET